jgi:hypothetical protein
MLAPDELERAVQVVQERVQFGLHARGSSLLRSCVREWCALLDWAPEVAGIAMKMDRAHAAHVGRVAFRIESEVRQRKAATSDVARKAHFWKRTTARGNDGLRASAVDYTDASDEAMAKMEPKDYILIALAIAASGYVCNRLSQRPQRQSEAPPPPTTMAVPTRWVLVLVINAGKERVIEALRSGGVAALHGDQLYQATLALWVGPETEFLRSKLAEWFTEACAVSEPSEYDVHLVRVEVSSDDPGLHRNANQMDRLDAFRRFQSRGVPSTLSPRLPADAYTTIVYSR